MHRMIAKHLIYYPIQHLRRQKVKKYIKEMSNIQYQNIKKINKIRNKKISGIIRFAYKRNEFYKRIFDKAGIKPNNINTVKDISNIPVLLKNDVLKNEKNLITKNFKRKMHIRKTGGSTGMTLHFMKESKALAINDAIMYRCYKWYGIDIGDKQARFWGVPVTKKLKIKEQFKDFILNRIRISAFEISEASCIEQYKRIKKFKPAYFYGYTTAIYGFCLFAKKAGIDLNSLKLKAVICTAEKMYPHHRKMFEEVFRCPVIDEYGSAEHGIIAFQCKKGKMHMMNDHLCIEFINKNNEPVKPGEIGRIVITDLDSYAMPLIRYDIGDMGKISENTCSCGINMPIMEIVEGRKEDFIKKPDGRLIHAAYLCYTLKDDAVHEFKMYQKSINQFLVQIVKSPIYNKSSEGLLEQKLRTALGEKVQINFEYIERIEREKSGKLRYFVSEINDKKSINNEF